MSMHCYNNTLSKNSIIKYYLTSVCCVEDEFILCEKDYCGPDPDPDETRQIVEPDSSSDEMEESDNLEQAELATESADFTSHDPVEKAAQKDDMKLMHSFINHVAAISGLSILLALACSQKKNFWINALSVLFISRKI